jgi:hypothetical protein
MNSRYGYIPDCVLSKGDDCTRQRQTCCETGTQSRESFVNICPACEPTGRQKIVWLPKAIGESGFSVYVVLRSLRKRHEEGDFALSSVQELEQLPGHSGGSSPTTRELCVSRKAPSLFSPSFFFPFTHSSFLNRRSTCNRGLSRHAPGPVRCGQDGPSGPTAIAPFALNVGDLSSTLTLFSMRV